MIERAPRLVNTVEENLSFLKGAPIGIDIDAVTQATYILALRNISRHFKKVISKDQLISYWELKRISEQNGIHESESLDFAKKAWNNNEVYSNAPEMPGIRTFLKILNTIKIPYFFISSRPTEFRQVTRDWFEKTFPWENEIIIERPDHMPGGDFKAETITRLGVKLHIEDATEEAEIIANKAKIPVLLVPQPWNKNDQVGGRIKHLRSYSKLPNYDGSWPILRFLARREVKQFFLNVAQS